MIKQAGEAFDYLVTTGCKKQDTAVWRGVWLGILAGIYIGIGYALASVVAGQVSWYWAWGVGRGCAVCVFCSTTATRPLITATT